MNRTLDLPSIHPMLRLLPPMTKRGKRHYRYALPVGLGLVIGGLPVLPLLAETTVEQVEIEQAKIVVPPLHAIVNSNQDGPVAADGELTLREAIHIVNGTLPVDWLSEGERSQITVLDADARAKISFNLPPRQTTIALQTVLPPLTQPGVIVDGTTQPGYQPVDEANLDLNAETSAEMVVPIPVVALTPAPDQEVFRGLTVVADNIAIRGLSLYGFVSRHRETVSMPPADIFIAHQLFPDKHRGVESYISPALNPPQGIEIYDNWLGVPPLDALNAADVIEPIWENKTDGTEEGDASKDDSSAEIMRRSAFGVYVFNSLGTTIRRNRIANHDGSAIITAKNAENLLVADNFLEHNGFGGMPDAIRLEGNIRNTRIFSNLIRQNAGSSIYMFKPVGAALIQDNTIIRNGRRYRRAAVYLMGNDHQVLYNQISHQPGPGVAVTGFPSSDRNLILGNQFSHLDGLSIDLVTEQDTNVLSYQIGDGANPIANSFQRKRKTANFGIRAPHFVSREFFINPSTGQVTLIGTAPPESKLEFYQVNEGGSRRGPLSQPLATLDVDSTGQFSIRFDSLEVGDKISATATHPKFGTSEPARNAIVRSLPADVIDSLPQRP